MSSGTRASPSSGSIRYGWPAAVVLGGQSFATIARLVNEHARELLETWNDYFGH
jgi:hypothetical protein